MSSIDQPPATGGKPDKQPRKHTTFSAKQRQCLRYILNNPKCNRWKLGANIDRGYAPDVVQYLRQKGIDIITDMKLVEGHKVAIGHYSIGDKSKANVHKILRIEVV